MPFRIEQKIKLTPGKLFDLREWIEKNDGKLIYPDRVINSIYFDNRDYLMYYDSMEGVLPRKKIRLRQYSTNFLLTNNVKKEIKISSVEGRYKTSSDEGNIKKIMNHGIMDNKYGACQPVINIVYERSYYKIKNIRVTIDKNISYKKVINGNILNHSIKDRNNVVELKYNNKNLYNSVIKNFPFEISRFSKYCRGVEFTNINYYNE